MKKLLTLLCAVLFGINLFASDIIIGSGTSTQNTLPIVNRSDNYISQQLYLESELTAAGATAGNITALKFYFASTVSAGYEYSRKISIYMAHTSYSSFGTKTEKLVNGSPNVSNSVWSVTKVYEYTGSGYAMPTAAGWYTITLDAPFTWAGPSANSYKNNIIVCIVDETDGMGGGSFAKNHRIFSATNRGIYATSAINPTATSISGTQVSYVPQITFVFSAAAIPSTPSDLAVSATTMNSATLAWSAVAGATSYDLQQSADGSSWTTLASGETGTSFDWTGLSVASTQYARIRATNASGSSDWSGAVTVTTDAVHSHNGITFTKWNSTNSMPLSGNYYLANNVTITGVGPKELSGDLNLCLNGHTLAFTQSNGCIQVGSGETLAIYDAEGSGKITSPHGTATIQVASEGTLAIHGGMIENTAGEKAIKAVAGLDAAHISIDVFDTKDNSAYFNLVSSSGGLIKDPVDGSLDLQVHTNRAFTSSQYNTICVPFPITSAQMSSIFGSGYDLREFDHSEFDGEELNLYFTQRTDLAAGKPYLLKPSHDVADMTHPWSNIEVSAPVDNTSDTYISFHGVFAPTTLTQNDKNLLFLGADNELFWPNTTNPLKGFRAYFEVKGGARKAVRARIVKGEESMQALDNTVAPNTVQKRIINGQLFIEKNGTLYNAQGQIVK